MERKSGLAWMQNTDNPPKCSNYRWARAIYTYTGGPTRKMRGRGA